MKALVPHFNFEVMAHYKREEKLCFVDSVAVQSGVPRLQENPLAVLAYTTLVMKLCPRSVHIQGV